MFKQAQEKQPAADKELQAQEPHERPPSSQNSHGDQHPPTLRPTLSRGVTTGVSTPHDAVLAELFSHRPGTGVEAVPEVAGRTEGETSNRAQSSSRTPLHDPFAGSLIGLSIQDDGDHARHDRTQFEERKEDLWSHMGNIRDIQTQIANMHVAMENIGLGHQAVQLSVERVHSTTVSEGEKWGEEGDEDEVKEKDVREQEFTKLANKFHGRKEATENIMTKVRFDSVLQLYHRVVSSFSYR